MSIQSALDLISSVFKAKRFVSSCCALVVCFAPSVLLAQPHDPIEELFRFGTGDHLIIDRGGPVDAAGDINGDGLADIIVGSGAGGIRVIFGPTQGNNGVLNAQRINGRNGFIINHDFQHVSVVAGIGDLNADGFDDVLMGSLSSSHIVFGSPNPFPRFVEPSTFDGNNGFTFNSTTTAVASAGDVNGDGIVDIIIGNSRASVNNLPGAGASYVIYGKRGRFDTVMEPSSLNGDNGFVIVGANQEDRSGRHVGGAGDFNHDGVDDFMIGAPNKTQSGKAEAGEAYLIYGRKDGFPAAISLYDINGSNGFIFKGSNIQDAAGSAVTGIGDLNHDGIDDIAISAPGKGPFGSPSKYPGETYILFGGKFDGVKNLNEYSLNGENGFIARGIRGGVIPIEKGKAIWGDLAGTSVDGAGDYNDDGIDDLVIGASHTIITPSRKGVGHMYLIYGSTNAFPTRLNLGDLDGANGFRISGIGTVDYFGVSVRSAGDFNADGKNDVIVGASGQGNSYVIYGRDPWAEKRQPPPPVSFTGFVSPGFEAVAFLQQAEVGRLSVGELADPTGPTPLPTSTSSVLGDPATPGDSRPNNFPPVEPLRPSDLNPPAEPEPVVLPEPPVVINDENNGDDDGNGDEMEPQPQPQPTPIVQPTQITPTPVQPITPTVPSQPTTNITRPNQQLDAPSFQENDMAKVSVGASFYLSFLLLFVFGCFRVSKRS